MSSFVPIYLKTYYKNDFYFNDTKVVLSLYNEPNVDLNAAVGDKLKFDSIEGLSGIENKASNSFVIDSMEFVDVVLKGDEFLENDLDAAYEKTKTSKSDYLDIDSIEKVY